MSCFIKRVDRGREGQRGREKEKKEVLEAFVCVRGRERYVNEKLESGCVQGRKDHMKWLGHK